MPVIQDDQRNGNPCLIHLPYERIITAYRSTVKLICHALILVRVPAAFRKKTEREIISDLRHAKLMKNICVTGNRGLEQNTLLILVIPGRRIHRYGCRGKHRQNKCRN